jgi:eukaryotic-like serine/threonine-protein kinase
MERAGRVKHLFHDALALDTGERHEFLSDACASDANLREEVESLLAAHLRNKEFLQESALGLSVADLSTRLEANEGLAAGTQAGPYRLVREIGRGGDGSIYLAERDDEEYSKQVAVKLVRRGRLHDESAWRFRRERQILADLDHPNIARLIDGGLTADGVPYLVMEYVEGMPIARYCDEQRLCTKERLQLFRDVCAAVHYAHEKSVIHRDIKPSNILVTQAGVVKLLDFGIAKMLRPSTEETPTTVTAQRALTPEYASPEQIRGERLAPASDVYSLGVVLYEILTGHRPYRLNGKSAYEVVRAVCETEPEPPSSAVGRVEQVIDTGGHSTSTLTPEFVSRTREGSPERLRRHLSGDLDNVVLMALRKDPERRYASVKEFSDDIHRYLERQPVRARKDSPIYRSRKFLERNRSSVVTAGAVAVLFLLIGLALNFFMRPAAPSITSIGVMPFTNVGQDQQFDYLAEGLTVSLIDNLARLPNLKVPGRNSVLRYKGQAIDPLAAGRALNVNTLLVGRATTNGETLSAHVELIDAASNQIIWNKRFDSKVSEILILEQQIADDVTRQLGLPISVEARARSRPANTRSAEAYRLYLRGEYFWNLRTGLGLARAIEFFESAIDQDPNYALAYSALANSYGLLGAYGMAPPHEVFPKAKTAALKAQELDPNLAEAYTSLGLINWLYDWDWNAADKAFRRAIELRPSYVLGHHWYGLYLGEMARFEEAIASEKRAFERDPLSVYVNADLARVYFYARRYDEALAQYQKTIEMNPNFLGFYSELAQLYEEKDMFDEFMSAVNPGHPNTTYTKLVEQMSGKKEFEGLWKQIWLESSKVSPVDWTAHYHLARTAGRLNKKDQAFEQLNRAFEVRDHLMTQIKVDPALDSLRSDPRFADLLRRMNL